MWSIAIFVAASTIAHKQKEPIDLTGNQWLNKSIRGFSIHLVSKFLSTGLSLLTRSIRFQ